MQSWKLHSPEDASQAPGHAEATNVSRRQSGSPAQDQSGLVIVLPVGSSQSEPDAAIEDRRLLDRRTQAAIGRQLRAVFDDVATAPVPERFLRLLSELEDKSSGGGS